MSRRVIYEVSKIEEILRSFDENLGLKGFEQLNTLMSAVQYLQSSGKPEEENRVSYEVDKIEEILRSFDTKLELKGFAQINIVMVAVQYLQSSGDIVEVEDEENSEEATNTDTDVEGAIAAVMAEDSVEDVYCADAVEE